MDGIVCRIESYGNKRQGHDCPLFFVMDFSLLSICEFLRQRNEQCEMLNHLLCGWKIVVIQKTHLSDIMKVFKPILYERKGEFHGK